MSAKPEFNNPIKFFALSMGKIFEVTHICDTMTEANAIMGRNRDVALITEDNKGRCYLAEQYGHKCPSELITKLLR